MLGAYYILWIVIGFGAAIFGIGCLIALSMKSSTTKQTQASTNSSVLRKLSESGFEISRTIYINDNYTYNIENHYKKCIHINSTNKQVVLIDYENGTFYILKFSEIINYEVYENDNLITTGGATGGLFTSIGTASTTQNCKDLKLIIRINNFETPQIVYSLINESLFGSSKTSTEYKKCIASLQEAVSFLEVVKSNNTKKRSKE